MTSWQAIPSTAMPPSRDMEELGSSMESTLPVSPSVKHSFASFLRPMADQLIVGWKWLERKRTQQLSSRRLRVAETISLGEKRFVTILQVDGAQFLIGGAAGNVSLLAILNKEEGAAINQSRLMATEERSAR